MDSPRYSGKILVRRSEPCSVKILLFNRRHSLTACTTCNTLPPAKSKMATRGPQNYRWGLEKGPTQGYWTLWTFCKISLLGDRDHSFHESLKIPKWPPGGGGEMVKLVGFYLLTWSSWFIVVIYIGALWVKEWLIGIKKCFHEDMVPIIKCQIVFDETFDVDEWGFWILE